VSQNERIRVVSLTKRFTRRDGGGEVVPVDNVSFSVGDREMVVLLGPSGCGKTTLLRCIAGLERPDSGQIFIDGRLVFDSASNIFVPPEKRFVSMVFQGYALWPHMTVFDNVAYPLTCRNVPRRDLRSRVIEALGVVGLSGLDSQYPNQLSGGQQQRVALARAVASQTTTIFFDEPLSNVDAKVREQLRNEIQRLQQSLGFTGLYVTHDQVEAMALAHRIGLLREGRIEQIGSGKDLYWNPRTEYVANFVGSANLWKGKIKASERDSVIVQTDFGLLKAKQPVQQRYSVGDSVTVLARPEVIKLVESPVDTLNCSFAGTVKHRSFLGAYVETTVAVSDRLVRVASTAMDSVPEGENVFVEINPQHLVLLSGHD